MKTLSTTLLLSSALLLQACSNSNSDNNDDTGEVGSEEATALYSVLLGNDLNSASNPFFDVLTGNDPDAANLSLRSSDILMGGESDELLIGGLGADLLMGGPGNDVMIGGTEDFNANVDGEADNSDNRDVAAGGPGEDVFIWAPGDGSDYVNGGPGTDVVILGILGESQDADGSTEGAPFFNVNPAGEGSKDFDGIFLDELNQPVVRVSDSPGFCDVLTKTGLAEELDDAEAPIEELNIDHLVRFSIRGIANAFDAGTRTDDDGLRIGLTLKNIEFVVCSDRDNSGLEAADRIEVLDISGAEPFRVDLESLPQHVQDLII